MTIRFYEIPYTFFADASYQQEWLDDNDMTFDEAVEYFKEIEEVVYTDTDINIDEDALCDLLADLTGEYFEAFSYEIVDETVYMCYNENDTDEEGGYDNVFSSGKALFTFDEQHLSDFDFYDEIEYKSLTDEEKEFVQKNLYKG